MISTVNFHLTSKCNYQCKYCFAHFCEVESQLNVDDRKKLVKALCALQWVDKINFVGGEPILIGDQLIELKKEAPYLDILTISIDSQFEDTNRRCGRCCKSSGKVLEREHYIALADACHKHGIQLKINTVVSSININEDMADFINEIRPFHWKVFQVLKVDGENDVDFNKYVISGNQFDEYIDRQRSILNDNAALVKESNDLMRGSYLMVNPEGCFFDNSQGGYTVSEPILEVGIENALQQVHFDVEKFNQRGGKYAIPNA